jgi:hypothetical protein
MQFHNYVGILWIHFEQSLIKPSRNTKTSPSFVCVQETTTNLTMVVTFHSNQEAFLLLCIVLSIYARFHSK